MKLRRISYTKVESMLPIPDNRHEEKCLEVVKNCPDLLWYETVDEGVTIPVCFVGSLNKVKGCRPKNWHSNNMVTLRKRWQCQSHEIPGMYILSNKKSQDIVWGHFAQVFGPLQVPYWSEVNPAYGQRSHKLDYFLGWKLVVEYLRPILDRLMLDYVTAPRVEMPIVQTKIQEPENVPGEVLRVIEDLTHRVDRVELQVQTNTSNVECLRSEHANVLHTLSESQRNAYKTVEEFCDSLDITFTKRIKEEIAIDTLNWVQKSGGDHQYLTLGGDRDSKSIYRFKFQDLYESTQAKVNTHVYMCGRSKTNKNQFHIWHSTDKIPANVTVIRQSVGHRTSEPGFRGTVIRRDPLCTIARNERF